MTNLSSIHEVEASPTTRLASRPAVSGLAQAGSATGDGTGLEDAYRTVRRYTEVLCVPLASEDYVVQSMPDASPVKWHLAHTTWFFETFLLSRAAPEYQPFHSGYNFLFNSYYNTIGP